MVDESKEFISVSNDQFIPIKATPQKMMSLMNKMILERTDQLNAKQRHEKNPPKFKNEEEYFRCQTQQKTRLTNGAIVVGNVSEQEKKALNSDNDALLKRVMIMREKARQIIQKARMEGKSLGNYYRKLRGGEETNG